MLFRSRSPTTAPARQPGILTEPHELATAAWDRDRPQFKGIFVRNLCEFGRHATAPYECRRRIARTPLTAVSLAARAMCR